MMLETSSCLPSRAQQFRQRERSRAKFRTRMLFFSPICERRRRRRGRCSLVLFSRIAYTCQQQNIVLAPTKRTRQLYKIM